MKHVYLDIGNSKVKLAEYQQEGWTIIFEDSVDQLHGLYSALNRIDLSTEVVVSSVRKDVVKNLINSNNKKTFKFLTFRDIPPHYINYNTPDTLGIDRFFACLAAVSLSENDVVVIDAGSACTIDFMAREKTYQGGVIQPGLRIIKQAMESFLPELPVPELNIPDQWPGKSTEACIQWGLYGGFKTSILGFIKKYQEENIDLSIWITGGEAKLIQELIGQEIEMNFHKYLVFEGMRVFTEEEK